MEADKPRKIIETLKANGELEKTLIIFTSDNGVYYVVFQESLRRAEFQPELEEVKHRYTKEVIEFPLSPDEMGMNIHLLKIFLSDALIGLQDLYTTFAEITLQPMQKSDGLDSQSFLETLLGKEDANTRSSMVIQANNGNYHEQSKNL